MSGSEMNVLIKRIPRLQTYTSVYIYVHTPPPHVNGAAIHVYTYFQAAPCVVLYY